MDNENRLLALEEYCFNQNNRKQTDVYEGIYNELESSRPLSIGKRITQDYPALFAVFAPDKGIGFPVMTETQRNEITNVVAGIVVFNTTQSLLNQFDGTKWVTVGISIYTTTERNALIAYESQVIYNTTTNTIDYYDGTTWFSLINNLQIINQPIAFENLTTGQRNAIVSPALGRTIYNTTTNKLNVYTGTWEEVQSL